MTLALKRLSGSALVASTLMATGFTTALAVLMNAAPAQAFTLYTERAEWLDDLNGQYPLANANFGTATPNQQVFSFNFSSQGLTVESRGINGDANGFNRIEPSEKYSGGIKRGNPPGNNDNNFFDSIVWTFSAPIKGFFADKFTSIEKTELVGNFDGIAGDEVIDLKAIIGGGTGSFGLIADQKFSSITFRIKAAENNGADNFKVEGFTAAVPTPALLPGLIGMGIAALRKRQQEEGEGA